ncbi:MAG: hypothetical protein IJP45_08105 [Paludibacteraceae bacterium]|nr:hypothetical protein [Paludibacteraceae bacterium]MBQ6765130.1 hypothetical protein [Paludibacteraceae bacterium]
MVNVQMVNALALQRNKYKHLSDEEWRWFLQQAEGRERTADKLPTFAAIEDWWYPVRLSCEQCSSELTARYKAELRDRACQKSKVESRFLDLTGGYGVDTYFLSELFACTDYVEQNAELCRIATHNFNVQRDNVQRTKGHITVHNTTAEDFLQCSGPTAKRSYSISGHTGEAGHSPTGYSLIFLDPARRDSHGGKVFKLADCTPNVVELLPTLLDHLAPDGRIMLKLSPMLDITQALKELSLVQRTSVLRTLSWSVHVVAVKNEVKEVLLLSQCLNAPINNRMVNDPINDKMVNDQIIKCIDLSHPEQAFSFTCGEELSATASFVHGTLSPCTFLYEPNAAILKAGAFKLVGARFGLQKLDVNTHLYCSETLVSGFPGRVWKITQRLNAKMAKDQMANVLCRNYPLTPEQLKKKLRLRDGGTAFVIGCRVAGKPTVFMAERVLS